MTILVIFHTYRFRDLKSFYLEYVYRHMRRDFPHTVSYNRFMERQAQVRLLLLFLSGQVHRHFHHRLHVTGSKPIKRMHSHKTMRGWATKGMSTMGWFYGLKLHLVINDKAEIIQWTLTAGNEEDRKPLKNRRFTDYLFRKLFADREYISQELFEKLFVDDIHLITKIKKNMKNSLMSLHDKIMLRKRAIIETINDKLKNVCHIIMFTSTFTCLP